MNTRNVTALAELFGEILNAWIAEDESGVQQYDGPSDLFVADFLAASGVLVPASLTDEQASNAIAACGGFGFPTRAYELRGMLESYARDG